jgi:uncharacterized membrane protein YqiK
MTSFFSITPILFMFLLYLIPIVFVVLLLRWLWIIKRNSVYQTNQNQQIIELLKEIRDMVTNKEV